LLLRWNRLACDNERARGSGSYAEGRSSSAMATARWTPDELLARLAELGVETETLNHPPAPTCDEHALYVGHLGAGQAKQLFLRGSGGEFFLVSCLVDTEVDLKQLSTRLGFKASKPLRLSSYEVMSEQLGVLPGSVTPFALVNAGPGVRLLLDARFKTQQKLLFHPLTNERTTVISCAGLVVFLTSLGRTVEWVDFSDASPLRRTEHT